MKKKEINGKHSRICTRGAHTPQQPTPPYLVKLLPHFPKNYLKQPPSPVDSATQTPVVKTTSFNGLGHENRVQRNLPRSLGSGCWGREGWLPEGEIDGRVTR